MSVESNHDALAGRIATFAAKRGKRVTEKRVGPDWANNVSPFVRTEWRGGLVGESCIMGRSGGCGLINRGQGVLECVVLG